MPSTTLYDKRARTWAAWSCTTTCSVRPSTRRCCTRSSTAQLAGRRTGTARYEDARRGPGRWQEAVPAEGDRPRPPGHAQRTALPWRRGRLRAASALVRAAPAAQDEPARAPRRPDREARRRGDPRRRQLRARGDQDPGRRGRAQRAERDRPGAGRRPRLATRSSGCRPATCRRSWSILADSLNVVDILNADTVVIEQPALARMEEVYL